MGRDCVGCVLPLVDIVPIELCDICTTPPHKLRRALDKAGVSARSPAHLGGGGLVVEDGGDDHLDLQRLALVGLRREERRLAPLAEVHVEVDAEAVAQLDERAELLQRTR